MSNVTMELIQELRKRTGLGMMSCKKALVETNGDIEKAVEVLRKKGVSVSQKRSGNETSQGIIHAYIHPGSQVGVLIEINCETDFVARNETIKELAQDICMHIAAMSPACLTSSELDNTMLEKEKQLQREKLLQEKKPEHMVDKILEGKMQKFYTEVCLLNQAFIKNDKLSIQDVINEAIAKLGENIKIRRFTRYQIGA